MNANQLNSKNLVCLNEFVQRHLKCVLSDINKAHNASIAHIVYNLPCDLPFDCALTSEHTLYLTRFKATLVKKLVELNYTVKINQSKTQLYITWHTVEKNYDDYLNLYLH